jgi:hypothetical protein
MLITTLTRIDSESVRQLLKYASKDTGAADAMPRTVHAYARAHAWPRPGAVVN